MLKLKKAKAAEKKLRLSSVKQRNQVLLDLASSLKKNEAKILAANKKDLVSLSSDANSAFRDRLTLSKNRIEQMAISLKQVAKLADPLLADKDNKIVLQNKLVLKKVRSPLGVILMVFESRPNVALEAFSMGFKSGNVMILRGGKESKFTTKVLYSLIESSLKKYKLSVDSVWGITNPDRSLVDYLLKQKAYIDVVVPRGGEKLIEHVVENSNIPIIKNDRGMCHVYVHGDADINMAVEIINNSKTHRPGVCNSTETILINKKIAQKLLPLVYEKMKSKNVEWFGCEQTVKILKGHVSKANLKNWGTEYLDFKINCKVVSSVDEAIQHIDTYGSKHSEAIVTKSKKTAEKFQKEIDAAVVYWNASTRFTDGFEFGLGGELGISTQKLHVRGPVGLAALTSVRWIGDGKGQIRK